jgi:RNA polymerase sigma-70 factor (ECF subfamily)
MTRHASADESLAHHVMERMATGEAAALGELYDTHARSIYSLALRILGDPSDAEDIVQEVFTQAWRQAARYDAGRATVIGWLLMITRSRSLDRLRARQARPDRTIAAPLPDLASGAPGQEAAALDAEDVERLRAALDRLGDAQRTPIELAYYEGLSQSAIAERLGQPLGTVKTRMRSALAQLRDWLLQGEGT